MEVSEKEDVVLPRVGVGLTVCDLFSAWERLKLEASRTLRIECVAMEYNGDCVQFFFFFHPVLVPSFNAPLFVSRLCLFFFHSSHFLFSLQCLI